jgi:hypothetical protein
MPKKRSDEKMGRPHTAQGNPQNVDKIEVEGELRIPEADPSWSPIAVFAWESVLSSPASQWYTETDLVYGWMTCQAIHESFVSGAAMKIGAADSMMRAALFNEADRRRANIEITRKPAEVNPTAENNIAEFRKRRESA